MYKKYYVYHLIDPRDNKVFYIGKGSGNRINQHEIEAAKGVCSRKCKKINEIIENNLAVIKEKIEFFSIENDAYDFETQEISRIGLSNLTNVMPGGQKAWIDRERQLLDRRKEENAFNALTLRPSITKMVLEGNTFNVSCENDVIRNIIDVFINTLIPASIKDLSNNKEKLTQVYSIVGYGS